MTYYDGWQEADFLNELNKCTEQNDRETFTKLCDHIKQYYNEMFRYIIDLRENDGLPHNPVMKWTDKYIDIIKFYNKMD